jgi:hypothetical protein
MEISNSVFSINQNQIHLLNTLSHHKYYKIKIGSLIFSCSLEQIAFLSQNVFDHFISSSSPFEIIIDQSHNPYNVSIQDLISSFTLLDSLFHSSKSIEINETNYQSLYFLSEILDNPSLLAKCELFSKDKNQQFSLTSQQLQFLSQSRRKYFNNISVSINVKIYETNFTLFSLFSNKVYNLNAKPKVLFFTIPSEKLPLFISILKLIEGIPIDFNKFSYDEFFYIIQLLDCSLFYTFITTQLPIPSTVDESINFLQYHHCSILDNYFKKLISIISEKFTEITFDILKTFSFYILENIFSSTTLQLPNEDYLFSLISNLIEIDSQMKRLFKFVIFPAVSSDLLKKQFEQLRPEDIDFDLLEQFKTRLFYENKFSDFQNYSNRWIKSRIPHSIPAEISNHQEFLQSIPVEIVDHQGILSHLRNENPNSISFETPKPQSPFPSSNLFINNSLTFGTGWDPNNYFCLSFKSCRVSVSNYLLRAHNFNWSSSHFLVSWKLEGSNHKINWTLIDSQNNS